MTHYFIVIRAYVFIRGIEIRQLFIFFLHFMVPHTSIPKSLVCS